ncbi:MULTISPECIES: type II toxin-antitoxin system VapC family toxin [unclassified Burkholderia]|uniref:type II toxin-antitoxin system VapC family toxin n=1 Tax=unclassified Burkholderia TaxID=2613784 RepID=UPI00046A6535|nr:type II toxin-antitoxin system VapC family toxin [Burkholderia sp. A1]NIF88915.1 type II toxin-antitoxin system VapC family toxin [Burkholderia sp. Cy-637]
MTHLYMLDTNICSYIIRKAPSSVLQRLEACVNAQHRIVISAITYAEMRDGTLGKKASPKLPGIISEFVSRLDGVLAWDAAAVDTATRIRMDLNARGTPIGYNDASIAGHALSSAAILVTHNAREFERVAGLRIEDWVNSSPA